MSIKRVFCADVTKLIAADSWLDDNPIRDPEAATSFCDLTTVMSNPTDMYFHRRAKLKKENLGIVAHKWSSLADADQALPLKIGSRFASDPNG